MLFIVIFLTGASQMFSISFENPMPPTTVPQTETPITPSLKTTAPTPVVEPTPDGEAFDALPGFAAYQQPLIDLVLASSHESIATDLSNVRNPFLLSEAHRPRLQQESFVVSPEVEKGFLTLYERARYDSLPVFITSDSLLHIYHLLFDMVLRTSESQYFIPFIRDLNRSLVAETDRQYQARGTTPGKMPPGALCRLSS